MSDVTRRGFLRSSTALAAGLTLMGEVVPAADAALKAGQGEGTSFASQWSSSVDRIWLGPEYWANPLQDWRIANGRIECITPGADRNVHLLTHQLGKSKGNLAMSVRIGRIGDSWGVGKGSAGFRIGSLGPLRDYRNSLIHGKGLDAGVTAEGGLFIGKLVKAASAVIPATAEGLELRLTATPAGEGYLLTLAAHDLTTGTSFGQIEQRVDAGELIGNVALVANFGRTPRGSFRKNNPFGGTFWFSNFTVSGSKVEAHPDQVFGPILFSQYTLHNRILKMSAQMPPLGPTDSDTVRLQVQNGSDWETIGEEKIDPQARIALFRITEWDDKNDIPYRLAYTLTNADGSTQEHFWTGTVRHDPVEKAVITVADISCNDHQVFPNTEYVQNTAKLEPDFIAFVGDQFYEGNGGYGATRAPLDVAVIDYLRKWYLHGWTWRDVTRDRPSIALPDDHDVFQGNLWGEGGKKPTRGPTSGGYVMNPAWVNVVHYTQTAHQPDPYDPTPADQGISVYYGPMTYGGVSFGIISDRMFKSGPTGKVPKISTGREDHVTDPDFDPKTADSPEAELLGDRQMKFLEDWVTDWRGAVMKAVISQTTFCGLPTTHGGKRERLVADYDCNGWPQTPRNEALRVMRKAFATHIAGDQHLPAIVRYGIDEHNDGPIVFAGPAVNVFYPRWFEPLEPGANRAPGAPEYTGDFLDGFGNRITVLALRNGRERPRHQVLQKQIDTAAGLGVVRFDKAKQQVTFECWPFMADTSDPSAQFAGWPLTFDVTENYARKAVAWLPTLEIVGVKSPVVAVIDEREGELVYNLRLTGSIFQPKVFSTGRYTIRVSEPETGRSKELNGVEASPDNAARVRLEV